MEGGLVGEGQKERDGMTHGIEYRSIEWVLRVAYKERFNCYACVRSCQVFIDGVIMEALHRGKAVYAEEDYVAFGQSKRLLEAALIEARDRMGTSLLP
jgi:hypothetical protein